MADYLLPDVGEGLTEAEIVSWKVKVGDTVQINDVVVEIETAKSLVELPSPYAGVVTAIMVAEGETVEVGTPIISIGEPSADSGQLSSSDGDATGSGVTTPQLPADGEIDLSNPAASGGGEGESLVGRMKADRGAVRRPRRKVLEAAGERTARADVQDVFNAGAPQQHDKVERIVDAVLSDARAQSGVDSSVVDSFRPAPEGAEGGSEASSPLAKPPVRRLAKDLGVDLATVTPTGEGGVITTRDVVAAAGGAATSAPPATPATPGAALVSPPAREGETREPIKGVRKMMAQAMTSSAFTAPHVTEWVAVDITPTLEFCRALRDDPAYADVKVSPLLVLARACIVAMRNTPVVNSFWDEAAQEIVVKDYVNLGIAAATPRGLVVPNIKDADRLTMPRLAQAFADLTAVAREGKTQPAEMAGGTFTITNVGVFGVDGGTPIINPGESAILCFGAARRQPWVVTLDDGSESLAIRDVCQLTLSFDHRHIDGESGSRFLAEVAAIMADPASAPL
ncbi:MAG TPA: dihydrolipoamide acetyltransferase family protein [Marmoricola sp.]